jgi:Tfp pilus assembly protein PilX
MAITRTVQKNTQPSQKGFALLIAVIFMSVMLSLGLSLGSIAYKQSVLASGAIKSQYAFYVADAGLECLLYADQQQNLFAYPDSAPTSAPVMTCGGVAPFSTPTFTYSGTQFVVTTRFALDAGNRCVDVSIYKQKDPATLSTLFAQGYDVPCATVANSSGAQFVSRGLQVHY